ncbi:hypothetical protein ACJMK2_009208 [Sinanodonta woodiana]|uniref:GH16 domain-containing protein n=1 Tax=Sinanodonta woodiana TaxID=1069815 RepID=A0ABD3VD96_SINWO
MISCVLLLSLLSVLSTRANDLPLPKISRFENGIGFMLEDIPGLRLLHVIYGKNEKDTKAGPFHQAVDGMWYHRNNKFKLEEGEKLLYRLMAEIGGKLVQFPIGGFLEWLEPKIFSPKNAVRRGTIVFRDDFDHGDQPDRNHWDYEVSMYGGYNWEIQAYVPERANAFIRNGHLFLKPTLTINNARFDESKLTTGVMDMHEMYGTCTNADRYGCRREGPNGMLPPVMSAKITSKTTIRYGKVEVRARIPKGDWIWPAIWMLPRSSHYGEWPRSGEIDLMESRGNSVASDPSGHNHGVNEVSSTLHWGPSANENRFSRTHGERQNNNGWNSDFHVYSLDWTQNQLVISVDNQEVLHVNPPGGFWHYGGFSGDNLWKSGEHMAPFDQPFYLILNVAIGGTNGFFPDDWHYDTKKPWSNNSPHENADFWAHRNEWERTWVGDNVAMEIDWVQMTQY